MPAQARSFVLPIALACVVIALAFPAMAATPPAAPQAPSGFLILMVNYSHDWVNGSTLRDAFVNVTVKRAGSTIATVAVQADGDGHFWSDHGSWSPSRPDILPGDVVEATAGTSTASVNPVGEISGSLDGNVVSGQIHAGHLAPAKLPVRCEVWVENSGIPSISVPNVSADGGAFSCDFGAGTIQPGYMVAVSYEDPDGNQVFRVFDAPSPDLRINMWPEGSASVRADGLSVFHVTYRNEGSLPAENVLLTDTLAAGVTFVSSTSAAEPVPSGNTVTWSLGTVAPGGQAYFFVILRNSPAAGASLKNVVDISTTSPGDQEGNNRAEAMMQVTDGVPDANISQNANPWDVLPGDTYRVVVNYGNNGPVATGPVTIRVQIDPSLSLDGWASQNGYRSLWNLTPGTGGLLVFDAPALPGGFGDSLLLTLAIPSSTPPDTQLTSTVSIEAPLDENTGNNGPFQQSVRTTQYQRPDLRVDKRWGDGQLVKGGHVFYNLNYGNDGNVTQEHVILTDVLPQGTTFVAATVDMGWGESAVVTPASTAGGKVTWDLDTQGPGTWGNLRVELALDGVQPGDTIANTAEIRGLDSDQSWWNNQSTEVEQVNEPGANLRLRSESNWEGPGQVRFQLHFENVGTTAVDDVQVTDTVPQGLEFNNDWWPNWWRDLNMSYNPSTRVITWTTSRLEPGWAGTINFRLSVPQADLNKQGLIFQNAAQITVPPGELTPADNATIAKVFTGPDLYVEKSLWSGKVAAGELVTFLITFGNGNNGPWNTGNPPQGTEAVRIVDTLPEGMTFVRAESSFGPWEPWKQEDNVLTWTVPGVCTECSWKFLVTARIANTVPVKAVLTNSVEIVDDAPGDTDPYLANNKASWQGTVAQRYLYLPVLKR